MKIRAIYEKSLAREGHVRDPAQIEVIERLQDLQQRLYRASSPKRRLLDVIFRRPATPALVKGLYLWGGVGRGKTFLMDLFFESLNIAQKKRIHFHRMMREVHARLQSHADVEDPLDAVAAEMAAETRVLCFDEFFVSDIGDAMILGRLLNGLFSRGVTLVATSNASPDDLYTDGLQRQQFLPAIEQIKAHTDLIHMDGDSDYRLRLLQKAGTYLMPDDEDARERLDYFFDKSATSEIRENVELEINGRPLLAYKCGKGVAWFTFEALCDGPRSQADYIEIARWYPCVIVSGLPPLDRTREDQARRFIALVDEFYDRRVKMIVSADTDVENLYTGKRLSFEFNRTVSRLVEMQSSEYLALPHLS